MFANSFHFHRLSISFPFLSFTFVSVFQTIGELLTLLFPWSRLVQRKARPSPPSIVIIIIMHAKRCANAAVCIYTNRRHRRYQFTCGANIEWKIRDDLPVGLVVGRRCVNSKRSICMRSPMALTWDWKRVPCSSNNLFTLGRNHNNESRFMFAWIIFATCSNKK